MVPASVLWQNENKSVLLLDLPRSIEDAQVLSAQLRVSNRTAALPRRIISTAPPAVPFATPEPKGGADYMLHQQGASTPASQARELMTCAAVRSALEEIKSTYDGPWCLPRITAAERDITSDQDAVPCTSTLRNLPPEAHYINASIADGREQFLAAGLFDLIVLDPPWPNRSARRRMRGQANSYHTASDLASIRRLLALIPVASQLRPNGLLAVWVTNNPRVSELLTDRRDGVLAGDWQVEPPVDSDAWTWLKVTAGGKPVVDIESSWRKPYERLLVCRKKGATVRLPPGGKVIVSVPDVHSRKPNLRGVFEDLDVLPKGYRAVEIFARNLTAGWWSWGDQVWRFQASDHWVEHEADAYTDSGHGRLDTTP